MSNCGFLHIKPTPTLTPMSPFLAMLIESACRRLEQPEELAPFSVTRPRTIEPAAEPGAAPRLDRTV